MVAAEKMKKDTPQYDRILLSRMKFIGDVVLTTPVIRSVRNAFPDAFIAYLGDKRAVSLLEHNPHLNELIPFDFSRPTILEQSRVSMLLRKKRFDLAVDLFGNPRTALLTYLTGARTRVGPARKGRGRLYTHQVTDDAAPKTAVEFHNQYIRAAGIEPLPGGTELFLTDDERREARIYLKWSGSDSAAGNTDTPLVGIHPGATWPAKRWLPDRFGALAELVRARLNARVIMTAGPGDDQTAAEVLRATHAEVTPIRNLPLRQLAAVISQCRVFVSNDAGPMHIAAALGVPTIGVFGPGEEQIWFPYDQAYGHRALRKDVSCHPCHLDFCNRTGDGYMECMTLLHVDEVFAAVKQAFHRPAAGVR